MESEKKKKKRCPDNMSESGPGETMASSDYEAPFAKGVVPLPGEEDLPCVENDYSRAKAYLMRQCMSSGDNLWDHLNEVLNKILLEKPRNIGCTFEEFSYKVRECRFKPQTDHLLDVFVPPKHYEFAKKLMKLFQPFEDENTTKTETEAAEEEEKVEPNVMESFYYFEQGGVGLPYDEIFSIAVHLKNLSTSQKIVNYRFWGKILGTKKNYYIAECELPEEEMAKINAEKREEIEKMRLEKQEAEIAEMEALKAKRELAIEEAKKKEEILAMERSEAQYVRKVAEAKAKGLTEMPEREELPPWPPILPPPLPIVKKTIEYPPEPTGTGVNKKTYFVCSGPGEEWTLLPDVTPQQIVTARKIKRAFTGDLESDVFTYPSFPGKEKDLLRVQIARISAGTQISPLGYYTFNEEDEEEEPEIAGEEKRTKYIVNPDFEPVAIRDLVDPSMSFWVHHTQYILEQGRTTWWNPKIKEEGDVEEEEGLEEEEETGEVGPDLLTPLSEDSALDTIVPWSVRKSSDIFPEHSIAIVRSNLWPGAYAYAVDKKFDNVYIGNGHKFTGTTHSPIPLDEIQNEYPVGPEVMEISDPTPEEEEEWRLAHEQKQVPVLEEEDVIDDDEDDDE